MVKNIKSIIVARRRQRVFALDQIWLWIAICVAAAARRRRQAQSLPTPGQARHEAQPESKPLSFSFSLLLQPQDMRAQPIEALLGDIANQRILVAGQGRSDLGPILRFQRLEGGR